MTIIRENITVREDGTPYPGGWPVISHSVTHNGIVHLCGLTSDADPIGDVAAQTTRVLERVDQLLAAAGTDKSKALTAQVWLSDIGDFHAHNEAWNAWVDHQNPPVRACVEAKLIYPNLLVEIMVTAAL